MERLSAAVGNRLAAGLLQRRKQGSPPEAVEAVVVVID